MPIIASVFDSLSTKNQTIIIDSIDIKLGAINLDDQQSILKKFKIIFNREVTKHIKKANPHIENSDHYIFKHFVHILKNGFMSWHTKYESFNEIMLALLDFNWEKQWFYNLVQLLKTNKNSLKRLLFQASEPFLERIKAELITHYHLSELDIKQLNKNFVSESKRNQLELFIASTLFEYTSSHNEQSTSTYFKDKEIYPNVDDIDIDNLGVNMFIPISNAGLVLLNPIIPPLFEHCKLLKNNQFKNISSQEKAIFILHYLVNGKIELDESHSALYKIICGMDLDHPIPNKLNLSKKTLNLCNDALQSIINEWKALKNTGIDGLRENFILRQGNLKDNGDSYNLDISQESVDVILNYSPPPWTSGMIKFPWMKKILYVNWF